MTTENQFTPIPVQPLPLAPTPEVAQMPPIGPVPTMPPVTLCAAIAALCGAMVMLIAPWLSWIDVTVFGAHGSMSGVGGFTGVLIGLTHATSAGGVKDGMFLAGLGGILAILAAVTLYRRNPSPQGTFTVLLVGGLAGLGLMVFEWNDLSQKINGLYSGASDSSNPFSSLATAMVSITPGIGMYLGFVGAGLVVLGAALWFFGRPRPPVRGALQKAA